jgi:hypothetical protein
MLSLQAALVEGFRCDVKSSEVAVQRLVAALAED